MIVTGVNEGFSAPRLAPDVRMKAFNKVTLDNFENLEIGRLYYSKFIW